MPSIATARIPARFDRRTELGGFGSRSKCVGPCRSFSLIAMALSCNPKLLIADEPTTALDVTIQAQILELLADMKSRFGMAIMLITHAMGVVAESTERVVVMYAGKVVEEASVDRLFANPRHPYTQALLASVPVANPKMKRLKPMVDGDVPSPINPPAGCAFHTRCRFAVDRCKTERPGLAPSGQRHEVACWLNEGTGMPA